MDQSAGELRRYRFGVFEVDPSTASVRRGGSAVRLRGKPFDVLVLLLERPGEVVTREELRARLWGADTFVDFEHSLDATINRLRFALRDAADNPRFVETLPRRGYRLIAPVEVVTRLPPPSPDTVPAAGIPADSLPVPIAAPAANAPWPPRFIAVALVVLGLTFAGAWWGGSRWSERRPGPEQRPTVAVLPLLHLNGGNGQGAFSASFAEELVAQIGRLNTNIVAVVASSAASGYTETGQGPEAIGRALGVRYVLEGSVRQAGDRTRITVRLVDVTTEAQLWAESYERDAATVSDGRSVAALAARALVDTFQRLSSTQPASPTAR